MAGAPTPDRPGHRPASAGRPGWWLAILFGFAVGLGGALLTLTPAARSLDENVGLKVLFELRGPRPAPASTAVVSLDAESARRLDQPDRIRNWDRGLYAKTLNALGERGAAAVVFDVMLEERRDPATDTALADAIRDSGRVVLFQRLTRDERGDHIVRPLDTFAAAARGLGIFALPKIPARVSWFWPFFPVLAADPGPRPADLPEVLLLSEQASLPVVAFHARLLERLGEDALREVIAGSGLELPPAAPDAAAWQRLDTLIEALRRALRDDPDGGRRLLETARTRFPNQPATLDGFATLADIHTSRWRRYLNFYGPPRTIATVPIADLLAAGGAPVALPELTGKVVFVGGSGLEEVDQLDGFRTVFSTADGLDLSGVEIAATAYANIADGSLLRPLGRSSTLLAVLGFGFLAGCLAMRLRGGRAVAAACAAGAAYLALAWQAFAAAAIWLPLAVPVGIALPTALFGGLFWQYLTTRRERDVLDRGIRYYAPEEAIRKLVDSGEARTDAEVMYFTCMVSDVADYTGLAERTPPRRMARLTNDYFAVLGENVRGHGGEMLFIDGDSLSSVWRAVDADRGRRLEACRAALDIRRDVETFNRGHPGTPFATRIGLHAGWLAIGNVGGGGRFTYTVVGDIVNTASRIEELNKHLGTTLLAADVVTDGLAELLVRPLGRFLLKGKAQAIDIVEIVDERSALGDERHELCALFGAALAQFRSGRWRDAQPLFAALAHHYPDDGPSRFYARLCDRYRDDPAAADTDGIVRLSTK